MLTSWKACQHSPRGGDSFSNCVTVRPCSLLGNLSVTCRGVVPPKSPSFHVYSSRPSCMSLYSLRTTPEEWGVSRTTFGTLQVQWIILDLRLSQGSQLRKTLGNMANVPLEHFTRSGRPEIVTATSYGTETSSRLQQEGKKVPRNGGIWWIFN